MKNQSDQELSLLSRTVEPGSLWTWFQKKAQKLRAFLRSAGVEPPIFSGQTAISKPERLPSDKLRTVVTLLQDTDADLSMFKKNSMILLESREEGLLPSSYPSSGTTWRSTPQSGNSPDSSIYVSRAPPSRTGRSEGMVSISRSSSMYYPHRRLGSPLPCSIGPRLATARSVQMLLRMGSGSSRRSRRVHSATSGNWEGSRSTLLVEDKGKLIDRSVDAVVPRCSNMSRVASQRSLRKSGCTCDDVNGQGQGTESDGRKESFRACCDSAKTQSCTTEGRPSWTLSAERQLSCSISMSSAVPDVAEVGVEEVSRSMGGVRAALSSRDMVQVSSSEKNGCVKQEWYQVPCSRLQRNSLDQKELIS
ncbi:hypothetical protein CEUSTIGMA_g165.t1 [Chlamydomonas eustigma]|uniref:Uncharacterized protein n=1 Tax=Chlamydomonas eustigma TaxID=1157962 RepID=A0A250WPT9_9CHLO|nr:hypothetical protein CEUSTIGMA_g165.t1 [Chlamydomonas eustigma]|eukprot:GAX72709.1 hypothetical protein CEUSTIGMA_g165.t1 [Chlamydomonas eustigma]